MKHIARNCLLILGTLATLAGCGATLDPVRAREKFAAGSFHSMEALQPVLPEEIHLPKRPLRVAIAPPLEISSERPPWEYRRTRRRQSYSSWSRADLEVIEQLERSLIDSGVVSDLHALPMLALEVEGDARMVGADRPAQFSWLQSGLSAAYHQGFDAVVFLRSLDDVGGRTSPWAVLDLTLVGALFLDTHERHALSLMEGIVMHTESGGVLLTTTGQGEQATWSSLLDAPHATDEVRARARRAALEDLSANVVDSLARTRHQDR